MLVCISGTPGCGKTTVSRILSRITGFGLVDLNDFVKEHKLVIGTDRKRKSKIIDIKKLRKESRKLKGDTILEGHLSHFAKCDICVVLRTNPEELEKRLEKKGWNKEKIAENVEAEILDVCLKEAVDECGEGNVFEIDTTGKRLKVVAAELLAIIKGNGRKNHMPGKINWTKYLKISL